MDKTFILTYTSLCRMSRTFYIQPDLLREQCAPWASVHAERGDDGARYKRQRGFETLFSTGTDEHGLKFASPRGKAGQNRAGRLIRAVN